LPELADLPDDFFGDGMALKIRRNRGIGNGRENRAAKMRNIVLILGNEQLARREKVSVPALAKIRHAESI